MKIRFTGICIILFAMVLSSCGEPTAPEDLLEEDRYIAVFSELLIINQIDQEKLDGVSREYLKEQVFEEYSVTQEQFEETHRYYQMQPEEHLERLEKIETLLTEQRDQFQDRLNEDRKRLADSLTVPDTLSRPDSLSFTTDSLSNNDSDVLDKIN